MELPARIFDAATGEVVSEPNNDLALHGTEFHRTGLVLDNDLSFDEWQAIGNTLKVIESSVMWWVGDWLNFGERRWGEMYSQALDATEYSYQALRDAKWVAGRIELSCRQDNLSFDHHKAVAPLPPDEQRRFLQQAEQEGWSRSTLRNEVARHQRQGRLDAVTPPAVSPETSIVHGDCLQVEWPSDIPLIVADPPFGLSVDGASGVREGKGEWDEQAYPDLHRFNRAWLSKAVDSLAADGSLFVFGTVHNIYSVGHLLKEMGCYIVRSIVWNKPFVQRAVNTQALVPSHELIIWARKGDRHICNLYEITRDVWDVQPAAPYGHITEKPEALIRKIIELASNPGDLVADPFLGSGTTAAVAKSLKRQYWGTEQDERWWKIATQRIRETRVL